MGGAMSSSRCYPMISIYLPNRLIIQVLHNACNNSVEIMRNKVDVMPALSSRLPLRLFENPQSFAIEFSDANPGVIAKYIHRMCADEESVEIRDNFAGTNSIYTRKMGNLMGNDLDRRVEALSLLVSTTGTHTT